MKNLFFYSNHFEDDKTIGITQKVHGELSAFRELGYNVTYSAYTKNGVAIFDNDGEQIFSMNYKFNNSRINRVMRRNLLIKCCCRFLGNDICYDYAYLRFHFFDRLYNKLLKQLKQSGAFIIVEAHAYPYRIWTNKIKWPIYILDILFTPVVRNKINLVAIMGKAQKPWGIQAVHIDNGIDLKKYPKQEKTLSSKIRLISVANEQSAHAYYKVVNGLADYYNKGGKEDIIVNFVGEYMESTRKLIKRKGLENRFVFWGKMCGDELDEVFNKSDLGLGAFSHRNDDSGSCIKTKEYFARGIPFINGWKELAFDDSYPYVLRFDTADEIINMFDVVEFYHKLENDYSISDSMRSFAKANYTWISQIRKVLSKVEELQ